MHAQPRSDIKRLGTILILLLTVSAGLAAQTASPAEPSGVPILTGYTTFNAGFIPGEQRLAPSFTPIVLIPFGQRWLVEAEGEFEAEYNREDGVWEKGYEKNVEYLQLDFLASRYLTVVAGRFLTPFGTYNERLHPSWIKNLQVSPLIFPMESGSSNGAMLRGGFDVGRNVNLNYSAFFSALSTVRALESNRAAGGRFSLFFPGQRLELGASFQRILGAERFNVVGLDGTWQSARVPLELRGEFARSVEQGTGYWLESAYRFRRSQNRFLRQSQLIFRFDQFFAPEAEEDMGGMEPEEEEGHGALPTVDTQRLQLGWNYYIRDGLKVSFAYGRSFTAERNNNIWTVGIAYRFLVPLEKRR